MAEPRGVTASSVISFVERLEDQSTAFYEVLAERYPEGRDVFREFAESGQKDKRAIVRTYRETVTDALETGFSFRGLDLDQYQIDAELAQDADIEEALDQALALEERTTAFYREVAERSRSLLATIPMAFRRAAKRRERRKAILRDLQGEGSAPV